MGECCAKHFFLFLWLVLFRDCYVAQRILQGQVIKDGEIIKSAGSKFVLGFFGPKRSNIRYVGIWYANLPKQSVVWVANRNNPILGKGGVITIINDGNLVVLDGNGFLIWSTNVWISTNKSSAKLMDSGNLMLYEVDPTRIDSEASWESFNIPTDTLLPGMKIYIEDQPREQRVFESWKSPEDPSPGNYSMGFDRNGSPQMIIWEGNSRCWRSGYWNGRTFLGMQTMPETSFSSLSFKHKPFFSGFQYTTDSYGRRWYFMYNLYNISEIGGFRILWNGHYTQERWDDGLKKWNVSKYRWLRECDLYNRCGDFGICKHLGHPICRCVEGFVPKNADEWKENNFSGGCVRKSMITCERNITEKGHGEKVKKDGFLKLEHVKLPDFVSYVEHENIGECKRKCLENCSCVAYAYVIGIECLIWTNRLIDMKYFDQGGDNLYIRVPYSELGDNKKRVGLIVVLLVFICILLSVIALVILRRTLSLKIYDHEESKFSSSDGLSLEGQEEASRGLTLFEFSIIVAATNNFSNDKKLGQGGFGPVYKGVINGNQEVAIKRLSKMSRQGLEEFKSEITVIARLQHRNLVQLLGYCFNGEEKMLVYEFMRNRSLDSFIFDPSMRAELEWEKRFNIIGGIARGLVYLHRDSGLIVIHRDLKASNILLDEEMNPKISDFGMARICGGNGNEAKTNRVVGTCGYMAPEYAMKGLFSIKSDVYSFGILILEIVSGKKNTSYRSAGYSSIKDYAWDLWEKGTVMELADPIMNLCNEEEVQRCIQIALLCVQDSANYRPNMSLVMMMLEGETASLRVPRQPTFTSLRSSLHDDTGISSHESETCNDLTITQLIGR